LDSLPNVPDNHFAVFTQKSDVIDIAKILVRDFFARFQQRKHGVKLPTVIVVITHATRVNEMQLDLTPGKCMELFFRHLAFRKFTNIIAEL
jgi:hypothetical protein